MTQQELKDALEYNPETGFFTWRENSGHHIAGGTVAGIIYNNYRMIYFWQKKYRASRLAWFYMTGQWPNVIDHLNGDTDDNRWCNLRNTTKRGNMQNLRIHREGKLLGAHRSSRDKKWHARAEINGKVKCFGSFNTEIEAHQAYLEGVGGLT